MAWIKQVFGGELESSAKTPLKLIPEGKLTSVEQGLEYFRERKEQMSDTIWYTWNILGYGTIHLKHSIKILNLKTYSSTCYIYSNGGVST